MSRQATNWLPPFTLFPALDVHPSGHWNPGKWQSPMLVFWGMHLCSISPMMPCYFISLIKRQNVRLWGLPRHNYDESREALPPFPSNLIMVAYLSCTAWVNCYLWICRSDSHPHAIVFFVKFWGVGEGNLHPAEIEQTCDIFKHTIQKSWALQ
jgi:hypothetical protein